MSDQHPNRDEILLKRGASQERERLMRRLDAESITHQNQGQIAVRQWARTWISEQGAPGMNEREIPAEAIEAAARVLRSKDILDSYELQEYLHDARDILAAALPYLAGGGDE